MNSEENKNNELKSLEIRIDKNERIKKKQEIYNFILKYYIIVILIILFVFIFPIFVFANFWYNNFNIVKIFISYTKELIFNNHFPLNILMSYLFLKITKTNDYKQIISYSNSIISLSIVQIINYICFNVNFKMSIVEVIIEILFKYNITFFLVLLGILASIDLRKCINTFSINNNVEKISEISKLNYCTINIIFMVKSKYEKAYIELRHDIGKSLRNLCNNQDVELINALACTDYVYMELKIPNKLNICKFISYLKEKSIKVIEEKLNLECSVEKDMFWVTGYYISTTKINEKVIEKYIKTRDIERVNI